MWQMQTSLSQEKRRRCIAMDVKRMHDMIEKISECAKCEFDKGIECIDTQEMGEVVDMMKDLSEAMYYRTLTNAMNDFDPYETMEMFERYGDGRRHYDNYRYKTTGEYALKGKGTYVGRRGYEEPPYWHMTKDDYDRWSDMPRSERMRDLDRASGRMHFAEPVSHGMDSMSESHYDRAKRNYTESKEMHKDNTMHDKEAKMKSLDDYLKVFSNDVKDLIKDATNEEKSLFKNNMTGLMNAM